MKCEGGEEITWSWGLRYRRLLELRGALSIMFEFESIPCTANGEINGTQASTRFQSKAPDHIQCA